MSDGRHWTQCNSDDEAPQKRIFTAADVQEFQDSSDSDGEDAEAKYKKKYTPLQRLYFTGEMLEKYEPCTEALQKVIDTEGKDEDVWDTFEEHWENFMDFSWCSNWDGNKYDIVFYGVSGYTGYLMMEYLKRISLKYNPEKFTFAFAGRSADKVAEMRDREFMGTEWADTPIIQASYDDVVSMVDLAKSSYVIINVAGPYMLTEGEVLIDACCWVGTDYCDVSGEIPWTIRTLNLHDHAKEGGALIIPSAAVAGGYPDMLVYLSAKKMKQDFGEELRKSICYLSGGGTSTSGGTSGGTLASRAAMSKASDRTRKQMADPFVLGGFIPDMDRNGVKMCTVEQGSGRVTLKIRKEDMDSQMAKVSQCPHLGVWRAPDTYAFFNTRTIRRSNALWADLANEPYGKNFNYQQFLLLPPEASQLIAASGTVAATSALGVSMESEKANLEKAGHYYKQGEGPALEELDDSWLSFACYSRTPQGNEWKCAILGRDGYFETARCAVEMAMTMRFDREELPFKGGVLNAIVAGQDWWVKRVINSGAGLKLGDWFQPEEMVPPPDGGKDRAEAAASEEAAG